MAINAQIVFGTWLARADRNEERYAAFIAEHGSLDVSGLSGEEAREWFSILLAATGLDAEMQVLQNAIERLSR
jgi:hypothetical protein